MEATTGQPMRSTRISSRESEEEHSSIRQQLKQSLINTSKKTRRRQSPITYTTNRTIRTHSKVNHWNHNRIENTTIYKYYQYKKISTGQWASYDNHRSKQERHIWQHSIRGKGQTNDQDILQKNRLQLYWKTTSSKNKRLLPQRHYPYRNTVNGNRQDTTQKNNTEMIEV